MNQLQEALNKAKQPASRPYIYTLTFLVCLVGLLFYYQPGVGYEIVTNGEHVGYVKTKAQAERTIAKLERAVYIEKGDDVAFNLDAEILKGKMSGKAYTDAQDMTFNFQNSIDIMIPAYVIKSDNDAVMAVADLETADQILTAIQEPYTKEDSSISNLNVEFVQEVEVLKLDYVSESKVLEGTEALLAISPSAAVSRSGISRSLVPTANPVQTLVDVKTTYQQIGTVPVEPPIKKVADPTMYEGQTKVQSEGTPGVREVNRLVTEINGETIEEKTLHQEVIKSPVEKIVLYGTKAKGNTIIDIAKRFIGTPYRWGGTTPSGFDCSGFTSYVYRQAGYSLPRTSYGQSRAGTRVARSELKAGDLVYGPGHVGIYVGGNSYIHAPQAGQSVKISPMSQFANFTHGVRVIG